MLRLTLLMLSAILLVGSVAAAAQPVAGAPPFKQVRVERAAVTPGGEQSVAVELDGQGATTTILRLTVTYPGGATEEVLDQTAGSMATLTWQVPEDVPSGTASYELKTSGCGCGDRSTATQAANFESSITGFFFIKN